MLKGYSPQAGPAWPIAAITGNRLGPDCLKDNWTAICVEEKNSPGIIRESTHLGKHTPEALILLGVNPGKPGINLSSAQADGNLDCRTGGKGR